MVETRKTIVLPRGSVKKIMQSERVGKTTVYAALNYTSHSEEAKHIRKLATSIYGGVETKKPVF